MKLDLSHSNLRFISANAFENSFEFCLQKNRNTIIYMEKNTLNELISNGKCFQIETFPISKAVITSLKASVSVLANESSNQVELFANSTEATILTAEETTTTTATIILAAQTSQPVLTFDSNEIFYKYGIEAGDFFMAKSDDYFVGPLDLKINFTFFNRSYSSLYLHTNGFLSFDNPSLLRTSSSAVIPLISPFNADIDTLAGGEVFYREVTNDQLIFDKLTHEISLAANDEAFQAKWAFVATYYKQKSINRIN